MTVKRAIELRPGDVIINEPNVLTGTVELATVIDRGVQVRMADGSMYVRPEEHQFTVADGDVRCGGCGDLVDPTIDRCGKCGFPDGAAMIERGWHL